MSARPPFSPEPEAYWEAVRAGWEDTVEKMREYGYAVTMLTPEELNGQDAGTVEDAMVEAGTYTVGLLSIGVGK